MAGAGQAGGHTYVWKDALRAFDVHAEMTLNDTVGVFLGLISAVSPAERDQLSRRFVDSQIERKTALLQSVGSEEQAGFVQLVQAVEHVRFVDCCAEYAQMCVVATRVFVVLDQLRAQIADIENTNSEVNESKDTSDDENIDDEGAA